MKRETAQSKDNRKSKWQPATLPSLDVTSERGFDVFELGEFASNLIADLSKYSQDFLRRSRRFCGIGVSVVGSGFVYVRGLGERYSATQLNGAMIPTTEPERVVPLDMFPAGLIENIRIAKTYSPDLPAESGRRARPTPALVGESLDPAVVLVSPLAQSFFGDRSGLIKIAEEMDDVLGPRQQRNMTQNDNAIERWYIRASRLPNSFAKVSIGRLPSFLSQQRKGSRERNRSFRSLAQLATGLS